MKPILIILISILSGIFAGMGMGGGTFLIPSLSLLFGYSQIICQSTNVISFVVLGVICLFIYSKNKLIDFKTVFIISIPALLVSGLFSLLSVKLTSRVLKICFSIFIILCGIFYFIKTIIALKKKNMSKNWCNFLKTWKLFYIKNYFW